MSQPGIGVMLQHLAGNRETVEAFTGALNKTIAKASLEDNELRLRFNDGTGIRMYDAGQSCCESRWMHTDDDLRHYEGATLLDAEIADGGEVPADSPQRKEGEYHDVFESQFLKIKTSQGVFTVVNYVDHNGYYGGFAIEVRKLDADA